MVKFWLDKLAEQVNEKFPDEEVLHLNCGLSIRGPQHIGRIRGELCIPSSIKRILEEKFGRKAIHYIVLYDLDPIKDKALKIAFKDKEKQKKYSGVSLINLEDPFGCHKNWVEHFWADFGNYLDDFGFDVEIVKTSEFYKMRGTKELIKWILQNRKKVVEVVNKFRKRNPWPEDHIPINPICENCLSINHTVAKSFDLEKYTISYKCQKCGFEGETSLENAKLNWRLEWPALWKVLHIEFEPCGKDHASAGGSRETCSYFAKEIFGFEAPLWEWFGWVSLRMRGKDLGEMTASGFVGITPKEWLQIADAEILRFLFIFTRPHTSINLDLDNLPVYYNHYYKAQDVFLGRREERNERERNNLIRAFELTQIGKPKILPEIPYDFAALIAQVVDVNKNFDRAVEILKRTNHLPEKISEEERELVKNLLIRSLNWVKLYAPERVKLKISEEVNEEIKRKLSEKQKNALKKFAKILDEKKSDEELIEEINKIIEGEGIERSEFFKAIYLVILGKEFGPRLIPLVRVIGMDKVAKIISSI